VEPKNRPVLPVRHSFTRRRNNLPKTAKKCASFIKNDPTFAKKALKSAKKRKKLQKASFHPQEQRFFEAPKIKNPI